VAEPQPHRPRWSRRCLPDSAVWVACARRCRRGRDLPHATGLVLCDKYQSSARRKGSAVGIPRRHTKRGLHTCFRTPDSLHEEARAPATHCRFAGNISFPLPFARRRLRDNSAASRIASTTERSCGRGASAAGCSNQSAKDCSLR
jgi:hypothetical protein